MAKGDYIPSTDDAKVAWLENFSVKLPKYAETLEVGNPDVASVINDSDMAGYTQSCFIFRT